MLEQALSNTLLALPLAAIAWLLGRTGRHPSITHFAWVVVMLRLIMPPVVADPWLSISLPIPDGGSAPQMLQALTRDHVEKSPAVGAADAVKNTSGTAITAAAAASASDSASGTSSTLPNVPRAEQRASSINYDLWVRVLWLIGTALLVAVSGPRLYRFQRLLQARASPADARVLRLADRAAADLSIPLRARVMLIQANVPPFIWYLYGQPWVVLPHALVDSLTEAEITLVLMHELAHLRRRDHLVRWLDWAVVAGLWWNPVAWAARFGLRRAEELACDALVLRHCRAVPRAYGHCLVTVSERLQQPAIQTPVQSCTMGDGGSLERRIRLIMSDTLNARPVNALRGFLVVVACISLGAGVTFAPRADAEAAAADDQSTGHTRIHTRTLEATIEGATSLAVSALNGSIEVVRDDSATAVAISAVVHAREWNGWGGSRSQQQKLVDDAQLIASKDDQGQASIEVKFPGSPNNPPSVSITIRTAALESVEAATVNGTIAIDGDLGEIATETVNGNIDVAGAMSAVRAESVNGTVAVALAPGAKGSVTALATNGKVTLELPPAGHRAWNGTVAASVTNGSINTKGVSGTASRSWTGEDFEAVMGSGRSASAHLSVTNGSIRIRLP